MYFHFCNIKKIITQMAGQGNRLAQTAAPAPRAKAVRFDPHQQWRPADVGSSWLAQPPEPAMPTADARRYLIETARHRAGDAAFVRRWRTLLDASAGPERIFQSPEFFDYMIAAGDEGAELIAVTERAGGAIVGIVPVRLRCHDLDFTAGRRRFASVPLRCVVLLGSVPLLPADPALLDRLFQFLLARYPRCQAISLAALPADSGLWRGMVASALLARRYLWHLPHGWSDCHRMPLPADFTAYLAQFSAKRRYNLTRQLRLLREHGGDRLALHCIEHPAQLGRLSDALAALTTPQRRGQLLSDPTLLALAGRGLLLCYVLECAGRPCALMLGQRYAGTLYLHNLFHDAALDHLSAGTVLLHLAIEDLCGRHFRAIEFGYGAPGHHHPSCNVTARRAQLLVLRPSLRNRLLCRLHGGLVFAVAWAKRRARAD